MHTNHDDIHIVGLQDDCPACYDHAQRPWSDLDNDMLKQLIRRNYHYRYTENGRVTFQPRSDTEAIAMANITNIMERVGALMSNDPGGYIRSYLESKWRINFGDE